MKDNKINILIIPSTVEGGVWYYRIFNWTKNLAARYKNDFNIVISNAVDFSDTNYLIDNKVDIVYYHNGVYTDKNQELFWNYVKFCKENKIKTILDIDDYFIYGEYHVLNKYNIEYKIAEKILVNIYLSDYITTTTERYKNKLKSITNKDNVFVFRNCIDKNSQFNSNKTKSDRLRFGLTGGWTHGYDSKQIESILRRLPDNYKDKFQLVLCGYNTSGPYWEEFENKLTSNKTLIKPEHKELLMNKLEDDFTDDIYRRITSKKIYDNNNETGEGDYGMVYNEFDLLLSPLLPSDFNNYKSELKFIEAGFTNTGIIYTNTGPYRDVTNNIEELKKLTFGVDFTKGVNGWVKTIKYCIDNKAGVLEKIDDFSKLIKEKYDLDDETDKRVKFFKEIVD